MKKRAVGRGADRVRQRLIEARPAGAALELGLRREQRQVAAGAGEGALALLAIERARCRRARCRAGAARRTAPASAAPRHSASVLLNLERARRSRRAFAAPNSRQRPHRARQARQQAPSISSISRSIVSAALVSPCPRAARSRAIAAAVEAIEFVSDRILQVIVLVIVLGLVERAGGGDLGLDRLLELRRAPSSCDASAS